MNTARGGDMAKVETLRSRVLGRLLLAAALLLLLPLHARSEPFQVADIRVEGLQRIAAGTVFNYLPVQIGDVVSDNITAEIIRTLYATGFFNDVAVEREGDILVVAVRERPAVAEITLVGNKSLDTETLKQGLAEVGLPRAHL
jgi:outer membrane protein insertion porin family